MPELIENDSMWDPDDTDLVRNTKHVERAHDTYLEGAEGTPVQDDLDARVAMSEEAHDDVDNDELGTLLNSETNAHGVPSYTGGNVVNTVDPETVAGGLIRDAFDAGDLFATGGQIPPTSFEDEDSLSPYLDGAWLAEASKLTGEKFF